MVAPSRAPVVVLIACLLLFGSWAGGWWRAGETAPVVGAIGCAVEAAGVVEEAPERGRVAVGVPAVEEVVDLALGVLAAGLELRGEVIQDGALVRPPGGPGRQPAG